jgi:mannose-6-phosphate isomerase-like protein (cupin superfamily)
MKPAITIIDARDEAALPLLPLVEDDAGEAQAIVWPGMGAHDRSTHRIRLQPGARTVVQQHPSESVYYVPEGNGFVSAPGGEDGQPLEPGSMVHIGEGDQYRFESGDDGLVLIGGPCPADPALYAHLEEV